MLFKLRFGNSPCSKIGIFLLLFCLITSSFISLFAMPSASAANPAELTLKWTGSIGGGGEDVLTADVLPDVPGEEIFHAGGSVAPNAGGRVSCLNGQTGATIWTRTIANIGDTCQIQMVDMDNNGDLEIVVPLQQPAGVYILHVEDGSTMFSDTDVGGGRIDGGAVAGDVDGNDYPDLYVGIMGYEKQPTTGKIIHYEYDPSTGSIVERGRVRVWHPCAGGLALGDTDNDGVFELYMNERDVYFGDGAWGRGTISFWAENLTVRWQLYGWGASSNKPMLADVNKDGVQDVVTTDLSAGVCVLNSTDGRPLVNGAGRVLMETNIAERHNHYQSSIYDIDGDGNLEIMSGDGFEGDWDLVTVFDLYSWRLDAAINTTVVGGRSWKGPTVAEVTGDGVMDILITTFDHLANANNGTLQVYDNNYNLVYSYVGLKHRAIETVVQDIDRNDDDLNEVLVLTQGGILYCFDTFGVASSPRARSEVQGYSESRNFASEYVPFERPWADVISPSVVSGAYNVSTSLNQLSFELSHVLGELMDYSVTTSPDVGSLSGSVVGNGVVVVPISGLASSTAYSWQVNVVDVSGHLTSKSFWFYTAPYFANSAPVQGAPVVSGGSAGEDLLCQNQSTSDVDGDVVTNVYNWYKNGVSLTNLNLPLDTKLDADSVYSGLATARDYSGMGNVAQVFGATYTQGVVGGGLYFDGNDLMRVEEQNNALDGGGSWTEMSLEFWVQSPVPMESRPFVGNPLIWKADRYDLLNINSYRVDLRNNNSEQLELAWSVSLGSNTYTLQYNQTAGVTDWHHVVCTYKSGSGMRIYVDGAETISNISSSITGAVNGTDGPLNIVFGITNFFGPDFIGSLDEIRIYPFELSSVMVSQRYEDTQNGLSSSSRIPSSELAIGDQWLCQVTPNDGKVDGSTNSNNILIGGQQILLFEDFETGTLLKWDSQDGTTSVSTVNPYRGVYHLTSGMSSGVNNGWSGVFKSITGTNPVALSGYAYFNAPPNTDNEDQWVLCFSQNTAGNALAYAGIRRLSGTLYWAIWYYSGTTLSYNVSSTAYTSGWHNLELSMYRGTDNDGRVEFYVDGTLVSSAYNLDNDGRTLSYARAGFSYSDAPSAASTTVYIDNVTIDTSVTLPVLYDISLQSQEGNLATANLGTINVGGMNYALPSIPSKEVGVYSIVYIAESGYTFDHWQTTGGLSITDPSLASTSMTVSDSGSLEAIYFEVPPPTQYQLNVAVSGSGITNATGNVAYDEGTDVSVLATPDSGWAFNYWLLNDANVGSSNPHQLTMDANYDLTAVFAELSQYTLHVEASGSGSTNTTGDSVYYDGVSAAVLATADSEWEFSHWVLNGTNVGSANPYTLIMNANYALTAVFTEVPEHWFVDGFESGTLAMWSGQDGTTSVSSVSPYEGTYHLRSSLSSGANNGWSGAYKSVAGTNPLYLSAYVQFNAPPNTASEDQWVLAFTQSAAGNALAYAGIRQVDGTLYWAIWYYSGSGLVYQVSSTVYTSGWHSLEFAMNRGTANDGWVQLTVDGALTCSVNNIDNDGRTLSYARVGFSYSDAASASASTVYIDNVTIDG